MFATKHSAEEAKDNMFLVLHPISKMVEVYNQFVGEKEHLESLADVVE